MNVAAASPATPVTVLVVRRVRPGRAAEFEQLISGMRQAAAGFPGHLGGFLIAPEQGDGSYRTLFAFDSDAHMQGWKQSRERKEWLDRIAEVTYGDAAMRVLSGLEGWFALPAAPTRPPPPRWKMAAVTWFGIFPLVLVFSNLVGPVLSPFLHPVLGVAVVTLLTVGAMTWLVAPTLTRLFAHWLYPGMDEPAPKAANSPTTPSTEKR
jgi:antibiotic biosynthesis monooxygenase (ABM) superfamily enzyme